MSAELAALGIAPAARVVLVSPHPDDIAFSVGGLVTRLAASLEAPPVLVSCFGRGTWAPNLAPADRTVETIARVRAAEDRAYCRAAGLRLVALGLPDASLRGYDDDTETGPRLPADPAPEALARALGPHLADADVVLAPAGVGRHVDHEIAAATVVAHRPRAARTLWYEDLPYASGVARDAIAGQVGRWCQGPERPEPLLVPVEPAAKRQAISWYRSQVRSEDRRMIAGHGASLATSNGGGTRRWAERLWGVGVGVGVDVGTRRP